jgi:hypothetical protein
MKMANALDFAKKIISRDNIIGFQPLNNYTKRHKIVVFVPEEMVNVVTYAMAGAGAGKIGKYSVCSFRSAGTGTFKGGAGTNPAAGRKGKFEAVNEVRLEMVCDSNILDEAVNNMLEVHPYEEPAYEIYDIVSGKKILYEKAVKVILKNPVTYQDMLRKLNKKIDDSLLPVKIRKKLILSVIVNFSGKDVTFGHIEVKSSGVLFITKLKSGDINMSFN